MTEPITPEQLDQWQQLAEAAASGRESRIVLLILIAEIRRLRESKGSHIIDKLGEDCRRLRSLLIQAATVMERAEAAECRRRAGEDSRGVGDG